MSTSKLLTIFFICLFANTTFSQITPPNANSDSECEADCWDWFQWSPVADATGTTIPAYSEGVAEDADCNTVISATAEYTGNDPDGIDATGLNIGANLQGTTPWTDEWLLSFSELLTNPVVRLMDLFGDSQVCITDCNGAPISLTDISTGTVYGSGCFTGNDQVQLSGTYNCIIVTVMNDRNDAYNMAIGTCLSANLPPPCTACAPGTEYEYLSLANASGTGTGATADVNINGTLWGTATVVYSNVSVNEDLTGTAFGAIAIGSTMEETLVLCVELCAPITVQQVDVIGLETESQVWVGSALSGTGATALPTGLNLTQCGGGGTMAPIGNMVTNTAGNCNNQGNGNYTVGAATVSTLYFRYTNPIGGCVRDKATFRIGVCVPTGDDVIPTCPLSVVTYTTDAADYILNGPTAANTFQVIQDANGNTFSGNDCGALAGNVMDVDGNLDGDVMDVVDTDANGNGVLNPGILTPTIFVSPCAEVVDEVDCGYCAPPPPCDLCTAGDYQYINLDQTGTAPGGLPIGVVYVNGVCIGNYEFEFSDLDVRLDGNGRKFGGLDGDGGSMCLRVDFCDPQVIQQIDVIGLEVESMVSVGTVKTGAGAAAVLSGLTMTHCEGSDRMDADDITNGNKVTTAGPGCLANPNASYTVGSPSVSTLYFTYMNPAGGCTFDYTGFRVGICYNSDPVFALPICPIELYQVACTDPLGNDIDVQTVAIDAAGNIFQDYGSGGNPQMTDCGDNFPIDLTFNGQISLQDAVDTGTPLLTADLGCAEIIAFTDTECVIDGCTEEPVCSMCPAGQGYDYLFLDQTGSPGGLDEGTVRLNGVKIGTYGFLYSDLDNNTDGNGHTFGGSDNDGGTFILEMDLCEPITIAEIQILGLEVMSMATVGTTLTGAGPTASVGGMVLTHCDGSDRMDADDITGGNTVTTAGPGCLANPNATYTTAPTTVSQLYFMYHNPPGGCTRDYVGFRIGACVEEFEEMVTPMCNISIYEVDECPDDPNNPVFTYMQDGNGNFFDMGCPMTLPTADLTAVQLSPCATLTFIEECPICINPVLGKQISNVTNAASGVAGNVDVTFKFTLSNLGGAAMMNLVINDNLTTIPGFVGVIGAPTVMISANPSGTAVAPSSNLGYAGTGNLLNGTSGSLTDGDQIMVFVTVELDASQIPDTMVNTADGGGTSPGGTMVQLDAATAPLYIPAINLAKEYTNVVPAASGTLGNYDVTVQLVIENTGNVPLINLTLIDDLNNQLSGAYVGVVSAPMIVTSTATMNPGLLAGYNGNSVVNIFNGTSGNLEPGQLITVEFVIEVNPNAATNFLTDNQAMTSGKGVDPSGAPLMYPDGTMVMVMDDSDAGADPDSSNPNGVGDAGGSDDPSVLQIPEISLTKDCIGLIQTPCQPAGNVDVSYQLTIMNTGNVPINGYQVFDDLASEFGPAFVLVYNATVTSTSSPAITIPTINPGFNGASDTNVSFGGVLQPNQSIVITINIQMDPNAPGASLDLFNQANVSGNSVNFLDNAVIITDISDSGNDPNTINVNAPNNSDVLGVNETAEDPTPFPLPNINSAKDLVAVGPSSLGLNGYFTATYQLFVENTGNVPLEDICAIEEFTQGGQLAGAFVSVVTPPSIISSTASSNPSLNAGFNGTSNTNIFNGTSGDLDPGEGFVVEFEIEINPFAASGVQGLCNQIEMKASGLGCDGVNVVVTDLSDAGDTPESSNTDEVLGGAICSSDCTPFSDCFVAACESLVCNDEITLSVDGNCEVMLSADMLIEGVEPECLGNGYPSFYDIVILDSNGNPLPTNNTTGGVLIDASDLIGQSVNIQVTSNCNINDCWTTVHFEDALAPEPVCECETPYLADGVTPNPNCTFFCYEVWDLELLEDPTRSGNELLPDVANSLPMDNCIDFGYPHVNITYWEGVNCGETVVRRSLSWEYQDKDGTTQYISCEQNFLFDNLSINSFGNTVNGAWDGYVDIFEANGGDRPMQTFYLPEHTVNLSCGADASPAGIAAAYDVDTPGRPVGIDRDDYGDTPNIVEHNEGYPYAYPYVVVQGWAGNYHAKPIDTDMCNIYLTHTDQSYEACSETCKEENGKIGRTWTILDWCSADFIEYTQIIKRVDTEGPAVSGPDLLVSTDPWSCGASVEIPTPEHLFDDCDLDPTWSVIPPTGVAMQNGVAIDLPKGEHAFTYEALDCCGNIGYGSFLITVVDKSAPTAIALENIVLQLTNASSDDGVTGITKLYAKDVDNFSHDGCTDVHLEIRRPDDVGEWCAIGSSTFNNDGHEGDDDNDLDDGEYVKFCCEDVLEIDSNGVAFGLVDVILRVWDDGDMNGVFGSEGDNYNETWTKVRVEDKLDPVVVCPPTVVLECHEDFNNLDLTGRPFASRTCSDLACEDEYSDNYKRKPMNQNPFQGTEYLAYNPSCRRGAIERTWNCGGKTCTQWIIVLDTEEGLLDITWPEDQTVNCLDTDYGTPDVVDRQCELVGTTLDSDTFYFEDGACYKILNHWTVINWCDYDLTQEACDINGSFETGDYTGWNVTDIASPFVPAQVVCFDNATVGFGLDPISPIDGDCMAFNGFDGSTGNDDPGNILTCTECFVPTNCETTSFYWSHWLAYDLQNFGASIDRMLEVTVNGDVMYSFTAEAGTLETGTGWQANSVDVSSYAGQTVEICFTEIIPENFAGPAQVAFDDVGIEIAGCGKYEHTQVIKLIDTEKPVVTVQDTCFAANVDCVGDGIEIWADATDNGLCGSEWIKWDVEVDMYSDWEVDYTFTSFDSVGAEYYIAPTGTGASIHIPLPDGLPIGCSSEHRVRWTAHDGCGNKTSETSYFTIEDKKKPTPYMVNLSTALMDNGSVELWASDFDAGSFDNCTTDSDFLLFTFSPVVPYQLLNPSEEDPWYDADGLARESDYEDGDAELWDGDAGTSARVFDEDDLAAAEANGGLLPVEVYVWDLCGNYDYAVVNLKLIDNNGAARAHVAGRVATESGEGLAGVTMQALSEAPGYPVTTETVVDGEYMFEYNPMYEDYILSGEKNDDWLNGVTTLDIVLIQQHVLGIKELDSPYKLIAADANNDERISGVDLIQLRKLILGLFTELPSNDSWRFMDKDLAMDATNPWPFGENMHINDLEEDMLSEDFVAVKTGDVNGSVVTNLVNTPIEARTSTSLDFNVEQIDLGQGEVELRFSSANFTQVAGFQFTMEANASEITGVNAGALNVSSSNVAVVNGAITMSWNTDKMLIAASDELFSIKVLMDGRSISMSDRVAQSEAYTGIDLQTIDVTLSGSAATTYALHQNKPNPFKSQTNIAFEMGSAGMAQITIYDVTGKVLVNHNAEYAAGSHNLIVKGSDLEGATGVLYYKLEAEGFTATQKMILID